MGALCVGLPLCRIRMIPNPTGSSTYVLSSLMLSFVECVVEVVAFFMIGSASAYDDDSVAAKAVVQRMWHI